MKFQFGFISNWDECTHDRNNENKYRSNLYLKKYKPQTVAFDLILIYAHARWVGNTTYLITNTKSFLDKSGLYIILNSKKISINHICRCYIQPWYELTSILANGYKNHKFISQKEKYFTDDFFERHLFFKKLTPSPSKLFFSSSLIIPSTNSIDLSADFSPHANDHPKEAYKAVFFKLIA